MNSYFYIRSKRKKILLSKYFYIKQFNSIKRTLRNN